MRKPRGLKYTDIVACPEDDSYQIGLPGMPVYLTVRSAKAVGNWLINAAKYVEAKKKRKVSKGKEE